MDISKLHPIEIGLLTELKTIEKIGISQLISISRLKPDQVRRAVEWLREKNLLQIKETPVQTVELLKNGKEYLEKGIPEKRFLKVLEEHEKLDLKAIKQKAGLNKDELNYSLGFLRKNGLIGILKQVSITSLGKEWLKKEISEEKVLKELSIGKRNLEELDKGTVKKLAKRKEILKINIEVSREISLTSQGRKALSKIKEEEYIDKLTSNVIISKTWKKAKFRKFVLDAPVPPIYPGKKQAYLRFLDEVKQRLVNLGFEQMEGPLVENAFFNCDALFMPQDHPARGIHDIYYVKNKKRSLKEYVPFIKSVKKEHKGKWKVSFSDAKAERLLLRSQGTALSARTLMRKDLKIPGKYFAIARCYRPDVVDWKHLTEFNQLEGIVIGKKVNFRQLLSLLADFATEIAGVKKIKFVPGYFPFTEPSVEGHIYFEKLKKWLEVLPAGIFRPELTKPLGIKVPVIAWGIGIDRLFMLKYRITDIRYLFSQDLKWLKGQKVV